MDPRPVHPTPEHTRSGRAAVRVVDVINLSSSARTLLRERVLAMREAGIDNRIICMDGPYVASLRADGIPVHVAPLPRSIDPPAVARALWDIARYLRRERIDLVHTHCSVPGFIGRLAAALAGVPLVIHTVHGFHVHERSPVTDRLFFNALERVAGWCTDTLLTQNRSDLEQARALRIVRRERVQWIGNGVCLERFHPAPADRAGATPVILCVARMEPVKNHRLLFEAARLLVRRGMPFRLRLAGDGVLRAELERLASGLGLAEHVEWLGYREDMAALLAEADIAVLTSVKEGIPRAVLEAMAMALPVVATDVPGTREAVREGETGFLVPLADAGALADRLGRLLADPRLRVQLGARGREIAEREFDEATIVSRLQQLYSRRLAQRGLPVPAALAAGVRP